MADAGTVLISINTSWNILNFRAPLIRALQEAGYRVVSAAPDDAYTPRLRALTDRHISLPMRNAGTSPLQDTRLILRYLRILKETKPDVLLAYTVKPNVYGSIAAGLLGIPVINNVSGLGTAFIRNTWLTRIVKILYRLAFRYSHRVFFQNPEDRDLFLDMKLVRAVQTEVLPGSGVDLQHFRPAPLPEHAPESPAFVLIARMLWDKGVGEYVTAARLVKQRHPKARFRLLGPVAVENQTAIARHVLEGWVAEGVVEYLGETDDVREAIAGHDAIVLPSYREGMSRVLLEGAAMARPLIATDVPGCNHVIDDGVNGLLCRVRDAEDLARAICDFIALSQEAHAAMGAASRAKAESTFDERIVIDRYLHAIREVLPSTPRYR